MSAVPPSDLVVLAHVLSQDNPWIPMLTVAGIGVVVVFLLAAGGRLVVDAPGDLLLPFASVVLVAGLASSIASADWLLDQAPWIVPGALVLLIGMVVASTRPQITVGPASPRTTGAVAAIAVVAAVAAFGPLDDTWFGDQDVFAVEPGDATVSLRMVEEPDDEGGFVVEVTVQRGTIGDNVPRSSRPADPEQEMSVKLLVDGQPRFPAVPAECAADPVCTTARFELVSVPGEPLTSVAVELLTADQVPFASTLGDTLSGDRLTAP